MNSTALNDAFLRYENALIYYAHSNGFGIDELTLARDSLLKLLSNLASSSPPPERHSMTDFTKPPTINTVRDYLDAVLTTELVPAHLTNIPEAPAWHWRWMHGVLGLVSEQQEVLDAIEPVNLGEELGDRFWYHALTSCALRDAGSLSCPIESGLLSPYTAWMMTAADAKLCDLSKRLMCYTKKPTVEALFAAARESVQATKLIATAHGLDCFVIMQANINKLYARKVDALKKSQQMGDMNRDLPNERAVLEKSLGR